MRIKFVSKTAPEDIPALWQPLLDIAELPSDVSVTFDPDDRDYDFLIVYEDLPPLPGEKKINRVEPLACARDNTLLITTEPSSIRIDGPNYLRQFGAIWTSKPPSLTVDLARIDGPPPLRYFFGRNLAGGQHRDLSKPLPEKTQDLSVMCSNKAMGHTLHSKRLEFVKALKAEMGDALALFGRGFDTVDDKADAMTPYRYHIAIENHVQPGHITEKLTDCFLAGCLPFYFGAPDYDRWFPKDAVIPINIFDFDQAVKTIRETIESNAYEARFEAIGRAREIALKEWNTVAASVNVAASRYDENASRGGQLYGRHAFRKAHPFNAAQDAIFRARMQRSAAARPMQQQSGMS